MREAMIGLVEQLKYLENRLVNDMSWAEAGRDLDEPPDYRL
jgi:hypothetical protein